MKFDKIIYSLEKLGLKVEIPKKKNYDLKLFVDEKECYLKLFKVPKMANITINNKYMWQIIDKKNRMKFIGKTKAFMDLDLKNKIIVFYPDPVMLRKWINECEMVFIDCNTDIYGAKIVKYDNLEDIKKINWE